MIQYRNSTFEEVEPIWREKLWPNRRSPIESTSSMLYGGGYDPNIRHLFRPTFLVAELKDLIVGVASGHKSSESDYRIRGIYVESDFRGRGIMTRFIQLLCDDAFRQGCSRVWSAPRPLAKKVYESSGFRQTSDFSTEGFEFGPNCYVLKELN